MSDTPRTNSILERATIDIDGLPQPGPITLRHWMVISTIITSLGTESKQLERELAAVTKERDELTALLESEKATRNHIIDKGVEMQRERDEAKCIITDLTAHLHDAIAILGWSKPDWQRTIERAKGEV